MKTGLISEVRRIRELMGRLCEGVNDHDVLDKVWISYGSSSFDPNKFVDYDYIYSRDAYEKEMAKREPNRRISYPEFVELRKCHMAVTNKPLYFGLWASPVDSEWGWRNFCMREFFNIKKLKDRFLFRLSPDSRIYVVHNAEDLDAISVFGLDDFGDKMIDFRKLLNDGYDGIYITRDAVHIKDGVRPKLKGLDAWDVESICVFKKDVIIPIDDESLFPDDSELEYIERLADDSRSGYEIDMLADILKKDPSQWSVDDRMVVSDFTDDEIQMVKDWKLR